MDLLKTINWNGRTFGYDLLMINDHERNRFFYDALHDAKDKIVLDIGAGTGLLSVLAVACGARHVYAFEYDAKNYAVAQAMIKRSGLDDRITLICADAMTVDRDSWPHPNIDIIISETFANDCFTENFAFIVEHVERNFNLSDDHRWVPDAVSLRISPEKIQRQDEFDPGVDVEPTWSAQIQNAIHVYRDHFYHGSSEICLPVAQVPRSQELSSVPLARWNVDRTIRQSLHDVVIDLPAQDSGYIRIDWVLHSQDRDLWLNRCESWRSIAFKCKNHHSAIRFKFHPLTHALIATHV